MTECTCDELTPPFSVDPQQLRAGTPFVGQHAVSASGPQLLANDGWFPDIDLADFRAVRQIDDTHAHQRVVDVMRQAMSQVNHELAVWKAQHLSAGVADLATVASQQLGGKSTKVMAYCRAVYSTAQAILNHRYWGMADTVGKPIYREALASAADEYNRERWEAVQEITEQPRTLSGAI